ncbi:MAG: hypothetical protein RLZZ350_1624 [Verrucomicrobiota bacterium]
MPPSNSLRWFTAGQEIFPAMLDAIRTAEDSVRLESYIFADGKIAREFLVALTEAQARGVDVCVLVDALGSWELPQNFFAPLLWAGGAVRRFNPLQLWRLGVRDHRKLLVCDGKIIFTGGFNLADEYDGDGVTRGWLDVGVRLENPALAAELAASFDELFALAEFARRPLLRLRGFKPHRIRMKPARGQLLLSEPGRGESPLQKSLRHDLRHAREVLLMTAYFLPPWQLLRDLLRVARRGGRVRIILPGQSDVPVAQLAARDFYRRLLRAGVELYEYQPQILHAKLLVIDGVTYVGSANLDIRSLKLNYELLLRFEDEAATARAREIFATNLKLSRRIERRAWQRADKFWPRVKQSWAHFLLARVDPWLALKQFASVRK